MKNPYLILNLLEDKNNDTLTDAKVRTAYLQLVKQYSPDRAPERFKSIRRAFEQLKTEKKRLKYALFDLSLPDREDLMTILLAKKKKSLHRPNIQQIQHLLAGN